MLNAMDKVLNSSIQFVSSVASVHVQLGTEKNGKGCNFGLHSFSYAGFLGEDEPLPAWRPQNQDSTFHVQRFLDACVEKQLVRWSLMEQVDGSNLAKDVRVIQL